MLVGLRSRRHISNFELVRPASVADACRFLAKPGHNAVMAGGLDLIERMKSGETVDRIVHLGGIREMHEIRREDGAISIGALATHHDISHNELVSSDLPDLSKIWRGIANPRVRYAGTIGGNLMSALPHYDALPALMALGADAVAADTSGSTRVNGLNNLSGLTGRIVERVIVPVNIRLLAERSLHPIVSMYLAANVESGILRAARIAIGCAYTDTPSFDLPVAGIRVATAGAEAVRIAGDAVASLPEPFSDGIATGSYRRRMMDVLLRRLLIKLGSQP